MQTSKARNGSSEAPQKTSPVTPKSSRGSKKAGSESDSVSSKKLTPGKTSAERSPKITERRSPKSPVFTKKRLVSPSDQENVVTRLRDELKKTNDQLNLSESLKKQVQLESEGVMKMLTAMEGKLEESQNQLAEFSTAENARCQELHKIARERDMAWQSELEALQKQHSDDSVALEPLMKEIQRLKQQLDMVMKSEKSQVEDSETVQTELAALKQDMDATQSTVENLKVQINEKVIIEEEAKFAASEIQKQLEMANATIESLRSEGCNLQQSLNSVTSNLEESKLRVSALEEMVKELQVSVEDDEVEGGKPPSEAESVASESELELLRAALEAAEAKLHEEQIESTLKIQSAIEMAEHVKVDAGLRELELESTLQKTTAELLDSKARLSSMEAELPAISRMNGELKDEMEKAMASQFDSEMRLIKATTEVTELKANLLDKETQLQSIMDENEQLKSELKRDREDQENYAAAILDAERAKAAEQEALMRLGVVNGEVEKNNKKAAKVLEQLEAAHAVKSEMEAELRRLRVQSDQWRKAAEAAAAVLTPGNNGRIVERTGSLNSDYNSLLSGKLLSSPFSDDLDDESPKRKNGNMLRKIGGLWKKGSK